jgi:arabinogalactan endo-1,4-beta-galactosidase
MKFFAPDRRTLLSSPPGLKGYPPNVGRHHRRRLSSGIAVICSVLAGLSAPRLVADEFISGADMSHLAYFESIGIVYREEGVARDALTILSNRGLNCVRLRLFTSSAAQAAAHPYNSINNLDYTVPLAVRVKDAGLKFLLDFHYSDSWADPGKQTKPAAWTNLSFTQLKAQLQDYSSNAIAAFQAAGAMPDYVQIGNEITQGLLWNDGKVSGSTNTSWSNLGQLLKAAIAGVTNAVSTNLPTIIIHIDRGGDWNTTQWYFDNLLHQQVSFDMIALSYYPFWHGSLTNLNSCLSNAAARYRRPVLLVETDFPWNNSTNVWGIPASTNGQVQYVAELARIVKRLPDGLGAGIVWWGTEYQPVSGANQAGFGNRSFFNANGNVLPVADAFGQLVAETKLSAAPRNGSLSIWWPLSGAGLSLTSATSVTASVWTNVTNAIQTTGAAFNVTVPINSNQNGFYRLKSD